MTASIVSGRSNDDVFYEIRVTTEEGIVCISIEIGNPGHEFVSLTVDSEAAETMAALLQNAANVSRSKLIENDLE